MREAARRWLAMSSARSRLFGWVFATGGCIAGAIALRSSALVDYMTIRRFTLDANHFWIAIATFAVLLGAVWLAHRQAPQSRASGIISRVAAGQVAAGAVFGGLMLLKVAALGTVTRLAYTAFELSLVLMAASAAAIVVWILTAKTSDKGKAATAEVG